MRTATAHEGTAVNRRAARWLLPNGVFYMDAITEAHQGVPGTRKKEVCHEIIYTAHEGSRTKTPLVWSSAVAHGRPGSLRCSRVRSVSSIGASGCYHDLHTDESRLRRSRHGDKDRPKSGEPLGHGTGP